MLQPAVACCDELKASITGFIQSGNTYTANDTTEMIKETIAQITCDCGSDAGKMFIEVHFPDWKDHPNSQKCNNKVF
ncbi:MAG: hypothetical protein ABFD44_05380 [Anaerolineaceae bacterium]